MWRDSFARRMVAGLVAVVLVLQGSGCAEWMNYQQPPAEVLTEKSPEQVRVTRVDGKQLEVFSPKIVNDTLVGYRSMSGDPAKQEDQVVRIAVADIKSMEVRQANTGGVVVLVAVAGLLLVGAIVASNQMDMD
ncbi:MAG: hypothetical protein OEW17_02195 [Gemmatimonadota bacterium]|nr:hypothetical protein [Gemmatimonadota bacterium]MDH4347591.1 hypothetical protein [Gemmatimonadota bacterium]MDH5283399.1 hypothetical protein [Gemmatimonadota bacterium]